MPKTRSRLLALACAGCLAALGARTAAAAAFQSAGADRTLSPYFYIPGGDPDVDELPLESTDVDISVAGVIAEVEVTQTYKNAGAGPISARYVFPASTRAAVHGLEMAVGDRVIKAKIRERGQARREFERAKREGKSASLLEQQRPNVFSMEVANIMPGDEIEVKLSYTELLVPTAGTYELVFPTVVGPRYAEDPEGAGSDRWVQSPYTRSGAPPTYRFGLEATVASGIPLRALSSPSHEIDIDWTGKKRARLALDPSEETGGDRDFILRYRLAGDQVSSGLLLHRGRRENFFLLMVEPPERVSDDEIPPREYVFVLDVSGSMRGFPLDTAKQLMRDLAGHLRPSDRFNVLLFSGGSHLMEPRSVPATADNLERALRDIDQVKGGGGTRLLSALQDAMALPHQSGTSRSFVVVTDGYISAESDVFDYIKKNLGRANVFSFGIGSSVNRHLVEGIAKAGMGEPFVVTDPSEGKEAAARFVDYVRSPVLTDIEVRFDGFRAYDVAPARVPDVLAERPIIVQGKWTGDPAGTIAVEGITGRGRYARTFEVGRADAGAGHALAYLWARTRIAELSDFAAPPEREAAREEIVALGLAYNLLTRYTSFVAVHDVVRNRGEAALEVDQPLPMPQGVSNQAVSGGSFGVGTEPELLLLLLLALALAGLAFINRPGVRRC